MKKWLCMLLVLCCVLPMGAFAQEKDVTLTFETDTLYVPQGRRITAKIAIAPYQAKKAGVTFSVQDESIAKVDARGDVTGVSIGETTLTVTSKLSQSVTATQKIAVVIPASKVIVTADTASVHIDGVAHLTATIEPEDATVQTVLYSSSDQSVATVDADGSVTGHKRGACVITAASTDGRAKGQCRITVLQQPTSVELSVKALTLPVGKNTVVKATVLPKEANNKKVEWSSSDPEMASVDQNGRVTSLAPGDVMITATCVDDPAVSASITITDAQLAEKIAFQDDELEVLVGQTITPTYTIVPENTSDTSVSFSTHDKRVASVDADGVVTGVKAGKTTLVVETADGSKRKDHVLIDVIQPVQGVHFGQSDFRVGVGYRGSLKAVLEPSDASRTEMTWQSSDESVATVSGQYNKATIRGRRWGDCVVTGATADGGYTASVNVHVGSLNRAIKEVKVTLRNGKPYLLLENVSNMEITQIRYQMRGYDQYGKPVAMSTRGEDTEILYGTYDEALGEGERTTHGYFTFDHPTDYAGVERLDFAITGFSTDTGFVGRDGATQYDYNIPQSSWNWAEYDTDLYLSTPKE